jgi:transcriptional regulator with XRE-family HTH domain
MIRFVPDRNPRLQQRLERFGVAVRNARRAKGLSQEELAHLSGLHRTYVGSVERGERNISLASAWALADTLDMRLADLVATADADM